MAFSNLLQVLLIAENQSDKYQTHNDGISALEQAANQVYKNTATTSTIAVSKTNLLRNILFKFSGATADQTITFPSTTDTGNTINTQRKFHVWNNTIYSLTLKASTGTGAQFVLRPGHIAEVYLDFEDLICLDDTDATNLGAYDIAFFLPGLPTAAVNGMVFTAARAFTLPVGLTRSVGSVGTNPASAATLTMEKNGTTIGTINISTAGVVTFTFSTLTSFAIGDKLVVTTPNPQDAALADVAVTFVGTRV